MVPLERISSQKSYWPCVLRPMRLQVVKYNSHLKEVFRQWLVPSLQNSCHFHLFHMTWCTVRDVALTGIWKVPGLGFHKTNHLYCFQLIFCHPPFYRMSWQNFHYYKRREVGVASTSALWYIENIVIAKGMTTIFCPFWFTNDNYLLRLSMFCTWILLWRIVSPIFVWGAGTSLFSLLFDLHNLVGNIYARTCTVKGIQKIGPV